VSNAPCSLYHFRLVLDGGAGILFKRNVPTLNTLVIQGVKPRLEMDLYGTKVPVLEYDFSAAPILLLMGNNTIKLKSTLVLIGGSTGFRPDIERGGLHYKGQSGQPRGNTT